MPQMMPMMWLSLFIMFSASLILFATMNYYTTILKTKTNEKKKIPTKHLNWKW
uniref:ATP synthase complex subunit 8 n=1 Tax=Cryptotermes havilandi TaxID=641612 RepID=A0A7U3QS94_9NEOP|nr:ATP synthase F0 subunit 8 [Cryptotermes havilandi]QPN53780.1 ATP synthase F0 subunit 8 [Cryptotermes havilandi]URH16460.1 ATP synthase F0 subunit 8 [Cryptotermes havilandi]URX52841.1 ATP synthase F0 subunit 8 [Cryptotermes havilandi]URX52880.1 ATP synthase F0 subunit 8 [Cryptotermes havilandi]URX53775.1 ATP synthase F0 subunit 8 [Cryptotermes havilandi]